MNTLSTIYCNKRLGGTFEPHKLYKVDSMLREDRGSVEPERAARKMIEQAITVGHITTPGEYIVAMAYPDQSVGVYAFDVDKISPPLVVRP